MKTLVLLLATLGNPAPASTPALCPVADFQPCGGSLQGTWTLQSLCLGEDLDMECEFPFDGEAACRGEGNSVSCHWDGEGTATFQGKTLRLKTQEAIVSRYTLSSSCTAAVRPDAGDAAERCAALTRPPLMTCGLEEDLCICQARVQDEPRTETVPFRVKGHKLKFADLEASYCVKDQQLILDFQPHPKSWKYWIFKAAPRRSSYSK